MTYIIDYISVDSRTTKGGNITNTIITLTSLLSTAQNRFVACIDFSLLSVYTLINLVFYSYTIQNLHQQQCILTMVAKYVRLEKNKKTLLHFITYIRI